MLSPLIKIEMAFRLIRREMFEYCKRPLSTCPRPIKYDSISHLLKNKPLGLKTTVKGWVKSIRSMKKWTFIDIKDGSCCESIQIISPKNISPKELSYGCSVNISGTLQSTEKGQLEVLAEKIDLLGKCDVTDNYPFTPAQKHSFNYCRQYLHHRLTLPFFTSLLRIRNQMSFSVHKYFIDNHFIKIHTPVLSSNDCEGAGEVFFVQPLSSTILESMKTADQEGKTEGEIFFNTKAFLTVSGQLQLEAVTRSIPKVYTFNPTFRAENSKSRLHLSEFYMVEAEEAFVTGLSDILSTMENLVKDLILNLLSQCEQDFVCLMEHNESDAKSHLSVLQEVLKKPFTVMTFSEAKTLLEKSAELVHAKGFTKEQELLLVEKNGQVPIFIINWPASSKPFYMKATPDNPNEVLAVDLLAPCVGELCGGSVREDDYEVLHQKLTKLNLLPHMNWYLELRKFGNVPTAGFGMGFERFLQFSLDIENIKDTIPFPRWPHNLHL